MRNENANVFQRYRERHASVLQNSIRIFFFIYSYSGSTKIIRLINDNSRIRPRGLIEATIFVLDDLLPATEENDCGLIF